MRGGSGNRGSKGVWVDTGYRNAGTKVLSEKVGKPHTVRFSTLFCKVFKWSRWVPYNAYDCTKTAWFWFHGQLNFESHNVQVLEMLFLPSCLVSEVSSYLYLFRAKNLYKVEGESTLHFFSQVPFPYSCSTIKAIIKGNVTQFVIFSFFLVYFLEIQYHYDFQGTPPSVMALL